MWSLPDIVAMNMNAAGKAIGNKWDLLIDQKLDESGEKAVCECSGWPGMDCGGELRPTLWYDIFSDDAKGLLWLCEAHEGYSGSPMEGYFYCGWCDRTFIENYTWENYYKLVDDCEIYCLNCARDIYLEDGENWLKLDGRSLVGLRRLVESGVKLERKAPHLFAVGQAPEEAGLKFLGNVEFDSMGGSRLYGGNGTMELFELLREAARYRHKRAILILDAAYQFAVSVGVYVDRSKPTRPSVTHLVSDPTIEVRGSQHRQKLEDSGYRLISLEEGTARLRPQGDGDTVGAGMAIDELWYERDDHAGYTIEIQGVGYEYGRDLPRSAMIEGEEA